jgi:preprotein translocase subunit YajC
MAEQKNLILEGIQVVTYGGILALIINMTKDNLALNLGIIVVGAVALGLHSLFQKGKDAL